MFYKTGGPRALFAAFFLSCAGGHAQEPKPAANPLPEIEITVVECTFPANNDPLSSRAPTAADIGQLTEQSKQVLERVTATGDFGKQMTINHVVHPSPDSQASPMAFAPGETGTKANLSLFQGGNGLFEMDIVFQFRKQGEEENAKATTDIDFTVDSVVRDNSPEVIYSSSVPGHEGKFFCVIARLRLPPAGH